MSEAEPAHPIEIRRRAHPRRALKELTQSFQAEVAPQVVEVEGHTLRLTGTVEDQYREWRKLLKQLYEEETGAAAAPPPAPPGPPRRPPASSNVSHPGL